MFHHVLFPYTHLWRSSAVVDNTTKPIKIPNSREHDHTTTLALYWHKYADDMAHKARTKSKRNAGKSQTCQFFYYNPDTSLVFVLLMKWDKHY